MTPLIHKKVDLQLVGLNGNAFHLLGAFAEQAYREGWTQAEVKALLKQAAAGNYDHLLCTLSSYCQPTREPPPDTNGDAWDGDDDEDEDNG